MAAALAVLVVLLGAGSALAALGGSGGAGSSGGGEAADRGVPAEAAASAVSVRVLTTSQGTILRQGFMRVRVRMRRAGGLRVFGIARGSRPGGRQHTATRSRLVRMRRPGVRVLRLRLTRPGRRIVRDCGGARVSGGGRLRLRGATRSTRVRPGAARGVTGASESTRCGRGGNGDGGSGSPGSSPGAGGGGQPGSGGGGSGGGQPGGGDPGRGDPGGGDPPPLRELDTSGGEDCDFLDPSVCLYPFPNDRFTVEDESTVTDRRLDLDPSSVPRNRAMKPIDPTDQNRADGFSPGNMIITKVPGLDSQEAFEQTGAVPITDMERSFDRDQPVVIINTETLERHLIWAEVDANPEDPEDVTLIVRPGTNFEEGTRYIVALRDLKNADGETIPPREEFRAYRDDIVTENPDIEARRAHYEELFATLDDAKIERENLYLTWDFTVASEESLTGRAVEMRDDAFAQLGDTNLADLEVAGDSPTFVQNPDIDDDFADGFGSIDTDPIPNPVDFGDLDGSREFEPCSAGASAECEAGEHPQTARRITGTVAVPCYLDVPTCAPGAGFIGGQPQQTGVAPANVICTVPHSALAAGAGSSRPSLYGHGLLGGAGEVTGGSAQPMGQEHNFTFCATDWIGMSTSDLPNVATLLQDLSKFNTLVDRIQQGYLNFMYLGRWMIHPEGASTLPGFQNASGESLIDTRELFYDGNSQGGILSGGLTALSPDVLRSVHGVPGMNYSTLLRRSVDFDLYANGEFGEGVQVPVGLYDSYPNELERPLVLSMMQLLWDRGEANGYAHHMTGDDPLPNSPPGKAALLHPAFGDHQVANIAADVEARTIGASAYRPVFYDDRSPDEEPLYDLPSVPLAGDDAPFTGSAIVYWDGGPADGPFGRPDRGTPAPPTANVPPREGKDPHAYPRSDPEAREQKSAFMSIGGDFFNPCTFVDEPIPCYSDRFDGPTP